MAYNVQDRSTLCITAGTFGDSLSEGLWAEVFSRLKEWRYMLLIWRMEPWLQMSPRFQKMTFLPEKFRHLTICNIWYDLWTWSRGESEEMVSLEPCDTSTIILAAPVLYEEVVTARHGDIAATNLMYVGQSMKKLRTCLFQAIVWLQWWPGL